MSTSEEENLFLRPIAPARPSSYDRPRNLLRSTHLVGNGSRAPAHRRLDLSRIEATVNPARPTLGPGVSKCMHPRREYRTARNGPDGYDVSAASPLGRAVREVFLKLHGPCHIERVLMQLRCCMPRPTSQHFEICSACGMASAIAWIFLLASCPPIPFLSYPHTGFPRMHLLIFCHRCGFV